MIVMVEVWVKTHTLEAIICCCAEHLLPLALFNTTLLDDSVAFSLSKEALTRNLTNYNYTELPYRYTIRHIQRLGCVCMWYVCVCGSMCVCTCLSVCVMTLF